MMIKTPDLWPHQNGWNRWLCGACVLLILLASTGQAAHFCGLPVLDSGSAARVRAVSASTLCLTCLMAQSAAVTSLSIASFWSFRRVPKLLPPAVRLHSFRPSFHLYVRPPPVL